MLQKVGHAAQGEGNCRAGGTRCCSERKLQAVQRFLPGYDIIASRLDFSVWKRMKNLAGNRQPLIYGAFPVWRNCTVRAHICNLGASEWRKRKNGVESARTFRCRLHTPHLHPCHAPDAGKRRRKDGQFHGAGHVKKAESVGKDTTNILSDALWTFRRVGHGVGQANSPPENPNK